MLLHRSILTKVCLLLAICLVKAQYGYEKEEKEKKEVNEEDEENVDYAKIFAQETSAALTAAIDDPESPQQSEFVTPTDFEDYFKPAHIFGESNDEPVKAAPKKKKKEPLEPRESKKEGYSSYFDDGPYKEFFKESEKKQQKLHKQQSKRDEEVIPPGPSYISHQIPAHYGYDDDEDKSTSASEDVQRNNKEKTIVGEDFQEGRVEKDDDDYKLPAFTFEPLKLKNKPKVDYDTGKSSSTVSQYPAASGYDRTVKAVKAARSPKPAASTPYEKYSFQPAEDYAAENSKYFDSILSTVTPYNPTYKKNSEAKYEPQSTQDAPSQASQKEAKGCRKVASSSPSDDMNCFICENPKTNAKYTQCSYSSQKKPINFYEGNSAQYTRAEKAPTAYRYKRYAENEETDPYTYIRNKARKSSSEAGVPSGYDSGFRYEAEHYDESKPEITFSEKHSEDLKKNPQNCQKVEKDGMTCTVCKDPKSGGNFEQCSYTSKPKEKKYAYVTEKKFDNDEPLETKVVSQTKDAQSNQKQNEKGGSKESTEVLEQYQSRVKQDKAPKKRNEGSSQDHDAKSSEKKGVDDDGYKFTNYFGPSYSDSHYKGASSDRADKVDKNKKPDYTDFDEYHFKYFPEFAKQESKQEPVQETYVAPVPEATKQNVESVLAEFSKKDRSNCKKAEKKGMTCFLCVDKNNIQHEECVYVQQSKPETKHVAYHEASEKPKAPQPEKIKTEAPKQEIKQEPVPAENQNRYFFKNVPSPAPLLGLEVAASEQIATFVRFEPEKAHKIEKRSDKASEHKYDSDKNQKKKEKKNEKSSDRKYDSSSKKGKSSNSNKELKSDASAYDSERLDEKADPTIKTPEEFNVAPGEGAFSDETKAVYSKELGVQLPKYMLDKSDFEKEFDEFAGSF